MIIRPFEKKDAAGIADMDNAIWTEGILDIISPRSAKDILRYWNNGRNRIIYVAEENHRIVGYITGNIERKENNWDVFIKKGQRYLEIIYFYVLEKFRNKGVGAKLMRSILKDAKGRKVKIFKVIASTKELTRAVGFYERFGFKPYATKMRFRIK
ncbi:MAG: GNAT family N-acetyltransferase [archaeon]